MATEKRLRKVRKREKLKKEKKIISSRKPFDALPTDKQTDMLDDIPFSKENMRYVKELALLKEMIRDQYASVRSFEDYLIDLKQKLTARVLLFDNNKKYADLISDINAVYNSVYVMRTTTFKNIIAKYVRLSKSKSTLQSMEYILDMEQSMQEQQNEIEAKIRELQEIIDRYEIQTQEHEEPKVDIKLPELPKLAPEPSKEEDNGDRGTSSAVG